MKKTKDLNTNKGITLIALVITIIVMLILVAVTISMAVNGGLFDYAGKAVGETNNAIANESEGYDQYVQDMLIKYGIEEGPITNPYEADDWEYAWTCTDGVWSEMLTKGQEAEGDMVTKFYKTGKKISNDEIGIPEGNEYHLIIEKNGNEENIAPLANVNENMQMISADAWEKQVFDMMNGNSDEFPIIAYVTELIVCEGVTNIPDACVYYGYNLNKITMGNTVENIGNYAFCFCGSLSDINMSTNLKSVGNGAFFYCLKLERVEFPYGLISVGDLAFYGGLVKSMVMPDSIVSFGIANFFENSNLTNVKLSNSMPVISKAMFNGCSNLTNITIPNCVTTIEENAFGDCTNLIKIKFLTTDASKITIADDVFADSENNGTSQEGISNLPEGSKIYVLSEDMKTKLEGTYDSTKTTVEVVTLEEMNSI